MKVSVLSQLPDPIGRPRPHTGTQRGVAPTETVVDGKKGGAKEAAWIGLINAMIAMTAQPVRKKTARRVLLTESSPLDKRPTRSLAGRRLPPMEPTPERRARSHLAHRR